MCVFYQSSQTQKICNIPCPVTVHGLTKTRASLLLAFAAETQPTSWSTWTCTSCLKSCPPESTTYSTILLYHTHFQRLRSAELFAWPEDCWSNSVCRKASCMAASSRPHMAERTIRIGCERRKQKTCLNAWKKKSSPTNCTAKVSSLTFCEVSGLRQLRGKMSTWARNPIHLFKHQ